MHKAVAFILLFTACATTTPAPAPIPTLTRIEVLELERSLSAPLVHRDMAALRAVAAPDFIGTGPDGVPLQSIDELMPILGEPLPAGAGLNSFEDALVLRPGITVVVGEMYGRAQEGGERINPLRYTAVWLYREGQWQLAALHLARR